jgi:hypothetical protein
MEIVRHRVNDVREMERLDPSLGAEIDIRSRGGRLILAHEPHAKGPLLERYLDAYARARPKRLLILNPKEDGLDAQARAMLRRRRLENWFFLDLTFPAIVRLAVRGRERRVALRVSEHEPASAALAMRRKVEWAWLDCFSGKAPSGAARRLRGAMKICLVSPELEGYSASRIASFRSLSTSVDAVCTKHPELWR